MRQTNGIILIKNIKDLRDPSIAALLKYTSFLSLFHHMLQLHPAPWFSESRRLHLLLPSQMLLFVLLFFQDTLKLQLEAYVDHTTNEI
jgi:hypothetical protein